MGFLIYRLVSLGIFLICWTGIESDITGDMTHLARNLSGLLARALKQNNTLQTLQNQHTTFNNIQSEQKLDIDILNDKIDRQNNTDVKLTKQIENQNTEIKKQDTLIDKQTKQIERLNAVVDKLNTDNTQKQQQLDTLLDYIKRQNKTVREHEIQLEKMNNPACPFGWTYYQKDQTCLRVFGIHHGKAWSEARKICQTFGGDLVQIHDKDKNKFVYNLFEGKLYTPWIGVMNHARRGFDFKYVDGSDMGSYHPWHGSDPSGYADNDHKCVYMYIHHSTYPGLWNDYTCSEKDSYVCSKTSTNLL